MAFYLASVYPRLLAKPSFSAMNLCSFSSAVTIDPASNLVLLMREWTGFIASHPPLFTVLNGYDFERKEEPMAVTTQYSEA